MVRSAKIWLNCLLQKKIESHNQRSKTIIEWKFVFCNYMGKWHALSDEQFCPDRACVPGECSSYIFHVPEKWFPNFKHVAIDWAILHVIKLDLLTKN